MKNFRIATKLIIGFLVLTVLAGAIGVMGIIGLRSMSDSAESMYADMAVPLGDLALATEYFQRIRVQMRNAILYTGDEQHLQTIEADINDRFENFEADMAAYEPTVAEANLVIFRDAMDTYRNTVKPGLTTLIEEAKQGIPQEQLLSELDGLTDAVDAVAEDLRELTAARLDVMSDENDATTVLYQTLLIVITAVIAIALAAAVFLTFYLSGLISKPISRLVSSAGDVAKGNLQVNIDTSSKDEVGILARSVAEMVR